MFRLALYATLTTAALCQVLRNSAYSHEIDARGSEILGWQTEDISRVVSFTPYGSPGSVTNIAERKCITGYQFHFDVLNNLAFDIDETVELAIRFDLATSARKFRVDYDKNGGASEPISIDLPAMAENRFHVERVQLQRARFAGRGDFGTDFRISAYTEGADKPGSVKPSTTICEIDVERSFSTRRPRTHGWLNLTLLNERGDRAPARISVLDAAGRMPLPGSSALEIKDFSNDSRTMLLPEGTVNWPSGNRYAYYVDGRYKTRLPTGDYTLVTTKGIEYRYATRHFRIEDDATVDLTVNLDRWIDMPARGWTSGDVHVHIPRRDEAENHALWLQAQAEDLHITNSLAMGNIAATYFPQSYWGKGGRYGQDMYFIVAGQEDPRTAIRGHTVHLGLTKPVRDPARYLLYHEAFEQVARQGGISGYAHLDRLGARVGMALDVPFGHVRFIEVLQRGELNTDVWFEFLNLGFRIAPAAGSDTPYGARIGDVRSYVKTVGNAVPDDWFAGLARGSTFATNGPMIEFQLNEAGMGEQVALARGDSIHLSARVSINPDIDTLDRVELIEQGTLVREVTAAGTGESLDLAHTATADRSTWFVVRAYGKRQRHGVGSVAAVSAPIYVSVAGRRTWKQDQVGVIANRMKSELDAFSNLTLEASGRLDEWFETADPWTVKWSQQQRQMRERIAQAESKFDELIESAAASR